VIHEVDESIRTLVRHGALTGTDVEVVFDAPTKDWSSRRNAPTVDVYLYDIREELRRREVGRVDARNEDGRVTDRRQPPRWYKLSYLITAWTQRPEDEHRLLASLLGCFLRGDHLPDDVLSGSLADLGYPIPYTCGLPPPEDRALSDVWSALGGELKPSLDLVLIAPFDLGREIAVGPPVLEGPRLTVAPTGAPEKRGRARGAKRSRPEAPAGDAGRPSLTDERVGSRRGDPGRRLIVKGIPR
jgi:Pvc16 N-terminal domain